MTAGVVLESHILIPWLMVLLFPIKLHWFFSPVTNMQFSLFPTTKVVLVLASAWHGVWNEMHRVHPCSGCGMNVAKVALQVGSDTSSSTVNNPSPTQKCQALSWLSPFRCETLGLRGTVSGEHLLSGQPASEKQGGTWEIQEQRSKHKVCLYF